MRPKSTLSANNGLSRKQKARPDTADRAPAMAVRTCCLLDEGNRRGHLEADHRTDLGFGLEVTHDLLAR